MDSTPSRTPRGARHRILGWILVSLAGLLATNAASDATGVFRTRSYPATTTPVLLSPDGVLATVHGQVRVVAGKWTVLVMLDLPRTPAGLVEEIEQAYIYVNKCRVDDSVKVSWKNRLARIEQDLPNPRGPAASAESPLAKHRSARGLLDPIGTLVHSIFGLATSAEVDDIKRVIGTLHQDDAAIVNRLDEFTTIVNRTRAYEQETRNFVNAMSQRFKAINTWLSGLEDAVNDITFMVNFERILEDLELKSGTLRQLHMLYSHRRQDLHAGRLSEELLSVSTLASLLESIRTFEASPLADLNWYYANALVRPMWAATEFLVYEVMLPLVRPETFLLYRIQTWPTPLSNQTSAQIREGGEFGYNTANGDLFAASKCTGRDPYVCEAGPLYGDGPSALPCIRGILTSNPELMGKCTVAISLQPQTLLFPIADNEYVIASFGESLTTRCIGRSALHSWLGKGIHQIHVNHSCSIFGKGWSLTSIVQKSLKLHLITKQLIRPNPLNLTAMLAPYMSRAAPIEGDGSYPTLAAIDPLPLDVWTAPGLHPPSWQTRTPLWVWLFIPMVLLAITGFTTYCLFIRYRCSGITWLLRKWQYGHVGKRPTKRAPSPGEVGATAPLAIDSPGGTDATFHEILMTSLGVRPTEPQGPQSYTQLRGLLNAREENTPGDGPGGDV